MTHDESEPVDGKTQTFSFLRPSDDPPIVGDDPVTVGVEVGSALVGHPDADDLAAMTVALFKLASRSSLGEWVVVMVTSDGSCTSIEVTAEEPTALPPFPGSPMIEPSAFVQVSMPDYRLRVECGPEEFTATLVAKGGW